MNRRKKHVRPKATKREHRHKWQETARFAFNDHGVTRFNVYYKCRKCPVVKAEVEPKRNPGRPWWRR